LRHTTREGRTLSYNIAVVPCGQCNQILVRHVISPFAYGTRLSQAAFLSQSNRQ
jgi:hypothetical protein